MIAKNPGASIERAKELIYENRVARALAKNPDVSLSEARGHKPKPLPKEATITEHEVRALKEKAGNISLKTKLGYIDPERATEAKTIIKTMEKQVKVMEKKKEADDKLSSREWTLWSQEQKEREINYKELLARMGDSVQPKAQSIADKMANLGREMLGMKTTTKKYSQYTKRLEKLNENFSKTGFSIVDGIAIRTEGTSPEAAKALKIIEKMKRETEKMWTMKTRRPGTEGYYDSQSTLRALYKKLEALGLVSRSGDIVSGDVGYH